MTTTSPQTLFQTNSYWAPQEHSGAPEEMPVSKKISTEGLPSDIKDHMEKLTSALEGWSHHVQSFADEAGDAGLLALESDLLDLRDEVAYTLHQNLHFAGTS